MFLDGFAIGQIFERILVKIRHSRRIRKHGLLSNVTDVIL